MDTNVLVSAALKEVSWPAGVVRWLDWHGGLLKSDETEAELLRVLQRPRIASKISPGFVHNIRRIVAAAERVSPVRPVTGCRDPADDKFLALAVSGNADAIVSGDADLLVLDAFKGIPIITPATFAKVLARSRSV